MKPAYSREDLQRLSFERRQAIVKERVDHLVLDMRLAVIGVAKGLGRNETVQPVANPQTLEDSEVLAKVLVQLRAAFPGVTVETVEHMPGRITGIRFDWGH